MQLNMHDVYDSTGNIKGEYKSWLSGHKTLLALLPNLHVLNQHINSHADVSLYEKAPAGLYFSFIGTGPICSVEDIQTIQVCYQTKPISGSFDMSSDEQRSLLQTCISPSHLAAILGETEEQIIQYFTALRDKLGNKQGIISLAMTPKTARSIEPILAHQGHSISLAGLIYSLIFNLIEQLQMLNHLSQCEGCQSKLFQAQNVLETPDYDHLDVKKLSQQVKLNIESLILGFHHLVGQSIEQYFTCSRIKFAADQIRLNPTAKPYIVAQSGFTEDQFEAVFRRQFGVSSHHYKQIH